MKGRCSKTKYMLSSTDVATCLSCEDKKIEKFYLNRQIMLEVL